MKPKVWGAEAVSGWEEEEEEEEERSEMRSKGEPGSQQPTMEGRGPRQVNFFYNSCLSSFGLSTCESSGQHIRYLY